MDGLTRYDIVLLDFHQDVFTDTGSVFILFLTTTGDVRSFSKISQLASVITATLATQGYFGSALTVFSDIDGNGFPDMQVGVPGGGYFFCLFLGKPSIFESTVAAILLIWFRFFLPSDFSSKF